MCFNLSLTLQVRSLHRLVPLCKETSLSLKIKSQSYTFKMLLRFDGPFNLNI